MHRIFGKQEKEVGFYRPGAYLVPVQEGKVAVAKVIDRLYLLGGGIEGDETQEQCIHRECLEEAGFPAKSVAFSPRQSGMCWMGKEHSTTIPSFTIGAS